MLADRVPGMAEPPTKRYIARMATTAHTHQHREHTGESLISEAARALSAAGEQWTAMREAVFAELARHERPVSAYDIADNLSASRGKRVAPNSVYRILDVFVTNNLAMRVESANAFLANTHPGCAHDCIFLVCDECGEAAHVDDEGVSRSVRAIAADRGFKAERPVLEIRGLCKACS
jgi:Fur family transcriptional regulator, zinc uptake regulator